MHNTLNFSPLHGAITKKCGDDSAFTLWDKIFGLLGSCNTSIAFKKV